ncbi:MAG: aminomethyl-transferring glycine dehydrogenase subunit GcvPA [Candidatus Melainabacteria bacterium]|nr:aminomethyl-transferring glycine dehydrogenase subunit GcvPA [Candidatus Melainabacteria bacterium]MBX9672387.1 aminomethyl-transferring glycine dehydrogenase subunit GcvPA [Candidatus Obscuribacterales bacterium]
MSDQNTPSSSHIPYLPNTGRERAAMLKEIGLGDFEQLIAHIPKEIRVKDADLALAPGLSELELVGEIGKLAAKNKPTSQQASFIGGGSYRRFVPSVVPAIVSRSEFATAYTPYQPEVAQGSLQAIYEFQSSICLLTGMDVANASMYDGPTALAEAALMASRLTGRKQILVSRAVNPEYKMVTETYADCIEYPFAQVTIQGGKTSPSDLAAKLTDDTACFIVQYHNYFGIVEDVKALGQIARDKGALLIVVTDPIALGLYTAPGDLGADLVVGDGQSCGNYLSFGGPSAGYIACRKDYVRQLPGRLAGMTQDNRGQRAYTLTLQTREQHIRRAKATSNICTNQALNALAMLVYFTAMGPSGMQDLANISLQRAHYLAEKLTAIKGVSLAFDAPYYNEFVLQLSDGLRADQVLLELQNHGVLGGIDVSVNFPEMQNAILVAVTEMNPVQELDEYAQKLEMVVADLTGKSSAKKVLTV